jgi:O-antigen/teichoic acid export membrane protein
MNTAQKITYNTFIQIIGRLVFLIFSFISIKILARYLGAAGNGELTTIITFTGFFTLIADLGLSSIATREISQKPEMMQKIIQNALGLRIITAVITAILCVAFGFLMPYSAAVKIGLITAAAALLITFVGNIFDVVFQTKLKMQYTVASDIFGRLTSLLIVFLGYKYDLGFQFIVLNIITAALFSTLTKFYYAKRFVKTKIEFDFSCWRWLLKLALPLGLVFIINNLYFKIDTLILSLLKDSREVGLYGVSYKVLETTLFAGAFLTSAIVPILSKDIKENLDRASRLVKNALEALIALAMPIVCYILVAPKEIIRFLSTEEFTVASRALQVLGVAIAFIYINILLGQILVAADRRKALVVSSISVFSFNVILNLVLIPDLSYLGAAITTLASEIIILIINLYLGNRVIKFRLNWLRVTKIFLSAAAMSIIFWLTKNLNWHIAFVGLSGFAVYILANIAFKTADRELILSLIPKKDG